MMRRLLRWIVAASVSVFALFGVTASLETSPTSSLTSATSVGTTAMALGTSVTIRLELGPGEAGAVIGRPLTPISVAGVARRTTRRVVVRHHYYYHH